MIKKKILVLYANAYYPMHDTYRVHLRCFKKYSNHRIYYYNVDTGTLPKRLSSIDYDLIIFHTLFMSSRHLNQDHFEELQLRIAPLIQSKAVKVIIPQDEWIYTNLMVEMINKFNISIIFTCAIQSEWNIIYNGVNTDIVTFHRILTGYIDEDTLKRIESYKTKYTDKKYDLTYRVGEIKPWLGKQGILKKDLVGIFKNVLKNSTINHSLSYLDKDRFWGDDWFKFLIQSKYTLGMEGGASVLDPDGDIMRKGLELEKKGQKLTYKESELLLFPGQEDSLKLFAISPRHLECCITETCQILVEGEYFGILKPGIHYIELKRDLSNLDEVVKDIEDDTKRSEIVKNAYDDIVKSGLYTYPSFVKSIEDFCFKLVQNKNEISLKDKYLHKINLLIDGYHYHKISLRSSWINTPLKILRSLRSLPFDKLKNKRANR